MSCVTGPSKKRCHAAAAQWGSRANEHDSEGALIVSLLTQCLVQFCHLWMVPARRLGLMAVKRTEKKKKKKIKDERGQRNSQSWQRAEVSEDQGRNGEQMSRDRQVKGGRSEGRKWGGE